MGYYDANPSVEHTKTLTPVSPLQERGQRSYSPGLGRWVSREPDDGPIGLWEAPTTGRAQSRLHH